MDRRNVISLLGTFGVSALAGCTTGTSDSEPSDAPPESPTLEETREPEESNERITGSWRMADFDSTHSGYAPDERGPEQSPVRLWNAPLGNDSRITASGSSGAPAIADETLYVGAGNGDVLSMDATTGEVLWRNSTDFYISSSVAIGDEQLFVGAGDNHVHAFELADGDRNWERNLRSSVDSSVIYTHDLVISYPVYGPLVALDALDGEPVWEYDDGRGLTPSVADGSVYVPTSDSDCNAWGSCEHFAGVDVLDVETGERTDQIELPGEYPPTSTPAIDDRQLYVTAEGGIVYAVSLDSLEVVWDAEMDGSVGAVPTVSDLLFTGDADGTVYGFGKDTGEERFTFDAGSALTGMCVASDTLYVGARRGSDGFVHALDAATGDRKWSLETKEPVSASPVVVDGALFVADDSGTLSAFVDESERDKFATPVDTPASDSPGGGDAGR